MEWISVEDRLPKQVENYFDSKNVLVCSEYGEVFISWFKFDFNGWDLTLNYQVNVTHWMPLPEPPKTS